MTGLKQLLATVIQFMRAGEQSTKEAAKPTYVERDYKEAMVAGSIEALEAFLHKYPPEQYPDALPYYKRASSALSDYSVGSQSARTETVSAAAVTGRDPTKRAAPAETVASGAGLTAEAFRSSR